MYVSLLNTFHYQSHMLSVTSSNSASLTQNIFCSASSIMFYLFLLVICTIKVNLNTFSILTSWCRVDIVYRVLTLERFIAELFDCQLYS